MFLLMAFILIATVGGGGTPVARLRLVVTSRASMDGSSTRHVQPPHRVPKSTLADFCFPLPSIQQERDKHVHKEGVLGQKGFDVLRNYQAGILPPRGCCHLTAHQGAGGGWHSQHTLPPVHAGSALLHLWLKHVQPAEPLHLDWRTCLPRITTPSCRWRTWRISEPVQFHSSAESGVTQFWLLKRVRLFRLFISCGQQKGNW